MPTYHYTVANKDGKKLSGTIDAPSEEEARIELNNLSFSILALKESENAEPQIASKNKKFFFEAIDINGKSVNGTISSDNKDKAYQRLQTEFKLTVTAIWPENASNEEIELARKTGTASLQTSLKEIEGAPKNKKDKIKEQEEKRKNLKQKIDTLLTEINNLLQNYPEIEPDHQSEINKKIDKLLRIKNSTNFDYIIKTAEELITYIEEQEETLKKKGLQDKRIELKLKTKDLLNKLHTDENKPHSLSEDIVAKINSWQAAHTRSSEKDKIQVKFFSRILNSIKSVFTEEPEILAIKEQIKVYNKQIKEFISLYFKEPTKEYKDKVKNGIKTVWQARKKAKENLKKVEEELKARKKAEHIDEELIISFLKELNALSGWILAFFIIYYFAGLYLSTKQFGFPQIPKAFNIYQSHFFKFILVIIFLLHSCLSIKVNFFRNSIIASIILIPIFILGSIVTLLNF